MRNNLRKARFLAVIVVVAVIAATTFGVCQKARKTLPSAARQDMRDRWFYVSYNLDDEVGTDGVVKLLERAGKVNLNGMLWEASWDRADEWSADEIARFERVKEAANAAKVEIIPILWSIGYGTTAARNLNLAEGLPIRNLPFVVREGARELRFFIRRIFPLRYGKMAGEQARQSVRFSRSSGNVLVLR